jgi:hypothetical protein
MVSSQTQNPNLGKFWRALDWKMFIYFTDIWNILQTFGIFYRHLEYFMTIWYILCSFGTFFSGFGIMHQEKSGNPGCNEEIRVTICHPFSAAPGHPKIGSRIFSSSGPSKRVITF